MSKTKVYVFFQIRGRRVRVELASGMQDSRNAFGRGSRMGMDFKSDEPGDWRSTNRSSTNDDRGGILFLLNSFSLIMDTFKQCCLRILKVSIYNFLSIIILLLYKERKFISLDNTNMNYLNK